MVRSRFCWVLLAAVVVSGAAGFGQTTEQSIAAKLQQGPFVLLRGMYAGDKLNFDVQGNLIGQADRLPFGLSAVLVKRVVLTDTELTVNGRREGLEFQKLPVKHGVRQLIAAPVDRKGMANVTVTVARDPTHPEALETALARVFSIGIDGAVALNAPEYWRFWLVNEIHPELKAQLPAPLKANNGPGTHLTGKVSPPRLTYSLDLNYYVAAARAAHFYGISVIGLTIGADGTPRNVHIVHPLGMGLDEVAVQAVGQYRFKPAMWDGKAVPVEIDVEVNFPG